MGPYWPVWARMGPARPLKSGKSSGRTHPLFLDIFAKNVVFGIQTTFVYSFDVLLSFLAETWYRTNMKSPQKVSFGPETCEIGPKVWLRTCPDLPRPVQEDKSLSAKQVFPFFSYGNYTFTMFISEFIIFPMFMNKFITFYEIITFIKWIYDLLTKSKKILSTFMILLLLTE